MYLLKRIVCWLFGHDWNKYSLVSSCSKKYCNRCEYEEDK